MVNVNDLTITSLETITAFDVATGDYKFTLDELQNATIAQGQEVTDITGKGGRKLSSLKKNKTVTISGSNGLISGGLLEVQTGGEFENKVTEVLWTDYLVVNSQAASTSYKAIGTAGAEIEALTVKNADGTLSNDLVQAEAAGEGKFAYNPETKALSFNTDIVDGTEIIVSYKRKIKADVLTNMSDTYSGKCTLYIDAFAEDKCARVYRVQFFIPKADFSGEFSIELGDNQAVHSFETQSLAGACGSGNVSSLLWTYTVFGAEAADVTA
ncbi:MAG: hypothetical protein MJZ03_00160 [archaeon]|nr:hypothetical protein [archaeon]